MWESHFFRGALFKEGHGQPVQPEQNAGGRLLPQVLQAVLGVTDRGSCVQAYLGDYLLHGGRLVYTWWENTKICIQSGIEISNVSGNLYTGYHKICIQSGNLYTGYHKICIHSGNLYTGYHKICIQSGNIITGYHKICIQSGNLYTGYHKICIVR